jgi:hypothetical protein
MTIRDFGEEIIIQCDNFRYYMLLLIITVKTEQEHEIFGIQISNIRMADPGSRAI